MFYICVYIHIEVPCVRLSVLSCSSKEGRRKKC